jgi:hypothetical protein
LNDAANDFATLGIISGNNVSVTDVNGLVLAASTVSGTLDVTTAGTLSQSGALTVTGATTLAAGSANNIALNNSTNDFSTLSITSANDVDIADVNSLVVAASTVSGALTINTDGALTQSGALTVAGVATFGAGAANNIVLDDAANDFNSVSIISGNNVDITDVNALDFAASTVSGALNVRSSGALTQSGVLLVGGATTLAAGTANNITLNNAANDFSTVTIISGNNVSLTDANALELAASTVSGALNVNTNGALTQSGALSVVGLTTLSAGSADITLNDAGNNFGGAVSATGGAIQLTQSGDLTIDQIVASGDVTLLAQAGTLNFGATNLPIQSGGSVTLVAQQFNNAYSAAAPINLTGAGQWQFYLANLNGNNFGSGSGVLASGNQAIWGTSYPTAISQAGNRYIFATAPTLTLNAVPNSLNIAATVGAGTVLAAATNGANYSAAGFVDASAYGNAFTQDTAANVLDGTLAFTSAGSSISAAIGTYDIDMTAPATSATGYVLATSNPYGAITVAAASVPGGSTGNGGTGGGTGNGGTGGSGGNTGGSTDNGGGTDGGTGSGGTGSGGAIALIPEPLRSTDTLLDVSPAASQENMQSSLPALNTAGQIPVAFTQINIDTMAAGENPAFNFTRCDDLSCRPDLPR